MQEVPICEPDSTIHEEMWTRFKPEASFFICVSALQKIKYLSLVDTFDYAYATNSSTILHENPITFYVHL